MNAGETTGFAPTESAAERPVGQVFLAYLVAVLLPLYGLLAGALVLIRSGRWAKRQGVLIIALSVVLMSLGISFGPMLVDSYWAGKAQHELNEVSSATERADSESQRELEKQLAQTRREGAATQARIRALQERNDSQKGSSH